MKKLKKIVKIILRIMFIRYYSFFYDKKYLTGKWFSLEYFFSWGVYKWVNKCIFEQKILGYNKQIKFPCSRFVDIASSENITFDVDDLQNFMVGFGAYYQNFEGKIHLGRGCYLAQRVALITSNHDPMDLDKHLPPKDIYIGNHCWIGIGSTVLPGVTLGERTIVGAGSVVTKSFPEGNCVIAGNPAKKIKRL